MPASEIKDLFTSPAALTITLGSLANSTAGVGRQSTMVDNHTTRYGWIKVYASITLGSGPSANSAVLVYLIEDNQDSTPIRSDGAGASDAAWTRRSADLIMVLNTGPGPSTGDVLRKSCLIQGPGPGWGIGIVNSSGAALNATNGNHVVSWILDDPEAQ